MSEQQILPLYPTNEESESDEILFSASITTLNDVGIMNDETLARNILELGESKSKVIFYTMSRFPLLALQLNIMFHFIEIKLVITDSTKINKTITLSNKRTKILIEEKSCALPLEIGSGWQYLNIDINKILHHCYRSIFISCTEMSISGQCKLSKAYFQEKEYSDIQLPKFLQVLNHDEYLIANEAN